MKILLFDPQNIIGPKLRDVASTMREVTILDREQVGSSPADALRIDVIVGAGNFSDRSKLTEPLLMWRTHPHTYLVPSWIATDSESFERVCLWPRLAIDRFEKYFDPQLFCNWLSKVAEWQQSRMQLQDSGSLVHHSVLELITCLALRRASGRLLIFDEEGDDGSMVLRQGCLMDATVKHLHAEDAFYEFFTWSQGSYLWEHREPSQTGNGRQPLSLLLNQGLRLLREANLLYHFLPDLEYMISKTQSESALDDGGVPFYASFKEIYKLIDGRISASQIIQASPLSRPITMSCLAKWFSLGDISITKNRRLEEQYRASNEQLVSRHRLLIVDDSNFMCRTLQSIFSQDSRFEIVGVAHDGLEALTLMEQQKPDVITLDINMPRMDGITALKHIMIRNPTPVVILSSLTKATSPLTYESFKYGAVSVFTKPSRIGSLDMQKEVEQLVDAVSQAANVQMEPAQYIRHSKRNRYEREGSQRGVSRSPLSLKSDGPIFMIGCGTGGFSSLLKLLASVTRTSTLPFIIACMAMPGRVVGAMVPNLAKDCVLTIEELTSGVSLYRGICYLYSYDDCYHLTKTGDQIRMEKRLDCFEHLHPLDHLLCSVAEVFGSRTAAMLISGKGRDGFEGMRYVQEKGGSAYVLSPQACLSPELPRRVLEEGYAKEIESAVQLASLLENREEHVWRPPPLTSGYTPK